MELVVDAAVIGVVPGVVEVAKRAGMPVKFAGAAAILVAILLLALSDLARSGGFAPESVAGWILRGTLTGLAAMGLYSQFVRVTDRAEQ